MEERLNLIDFRNYFLVFIILSSCTKINTTQFIQNPSNLNGSFKLIWRSPLRDDSCINNCFRPYLYNDKVIFSSNEREQLRIRAFDTKTGKSQWETGILPSSFFGVCTNDGSTLYDHYLFANASTQSTVIDVINGSSIWQSNSDTAYGSPFIYGDGKGNVYKSYTANSYPYSNYILRTPISNENWKVITKVPLHAASPEITTQSLNFYQIANGHHIVVYHSSGDDNTNKDGDFYIGAYDLDADSTLFFNDYTNQFGFISMNPIVYCQNRLYFTGSITTSPYTDVIMSIDAETGDSLWSKNIPYNCTFLAADNDQIIACFLTVNQVISYDYLTGKPNWIFNQPDNEHLHFDFDSSQLFGHLLLNSTSNYLQIFDCRYGTLAYELAFPDAYKSGGNFSEGVTIDTKNNVLYATNGYYAYALELPEELK